MSNAPRRYAQSALPAHEGFLSQLLDQCTFFLFQFLGQCLALFEISVFTERSVSYKRFGMLQRQTLVIYQCPESQKVRVAQVVLPIGLVGE